MERCLVVHPTSPQVWIRYSDLELKGRNVGFAKNLLIRGTVVLPRVDKLWYKLVYVFETLGDIAGARDAFARWLQWEPDVAAWSAAIKFECRYQEWDRARALYERLTIVHPEPNNWIRWAKWEEQEAGTSDLVRDVYTQAIDALGEDFMSEKVIMEFCRFEVRMKELERARFLYKWALDRLPRSKSRNLHKAYTTFEKQFGDADGVEDVVLEKRRVLYNEEVQKNPRNYDSWLDLARLEEISGAHSVDGHERVRDVYERAISNIPPSSEKRHWRRYIYVWLFYATWQELNADGDTERVAAIYNALLKLIPHTKWTSAKVWVNYSLYLVRQGRLTDARKVMGTGIGKSPKNKLFKEYIALEMKLFEFERCRTLFAKYLAWNPTNAEAWKSFAELERGLGDVDRARGIYSLAVSEDTLDMPELLWKEYIDFEVENEEWTKARELYERLLEKTSHVKVWTSFAQFEASVPDDDVEDEDEDETSLSDASKQRVRAVFERGYKAMKEQDLKEERVTLLNAWKAFENAHGGSEDQKKVHDQLPSKVKKRRKLDDDTYEEYMDWVFPADNEGDKKLSNLLKMAEMWKKAKEAA